MTITLGVTKLASDQTNVIVAVVGINSDQILPNPLFTLMSADVYPQVLSTLGVSPADYDLSQVTLSEIKTPLFSQFAYSFTVRFVLKGTVSSAADQFVGPAGPVGQTGPQGATGLQGPVGPVGPTGPTGPVSGVLGSGPIASSGGPTPTISITAASPGAAGSMSAAHYSLVNGATANPSPLELAKRDASGALVGTGVDSGAAADLAIKRNGITTIAVKADGVTRYQTATPVITTDAITPVDLIEFAVPNGKMTVAKILITARVMTNAGGIQSSRYVLEKIMIFENGGGGANPVLITTPGADGVILFADASLGAIVGYHGHDPFVGPPPGITILVRGMAGDTVHWRAWVETTESDNA